MKELHITKDKLTKFLPKEITADFAVKELISISHHNAVFCLLSKSSNKKYVVKILDKCYYDKKLYQRIFQLKKSFLLLPEQCFFDDSYCYFLYPQMITLTDLLSTKCFTYPMLRTLIADIGTAVTALHHSKIVHLDISPNNIFIDSENHFFLGDFSSSRFAVFTLHSLFHQSLRTGGTPFFTPDFNKNETPLNFWNDCYSFSVLLYMLTNNGNFPHNEKEDYSDTFDAFHSFLTKKMNPDLTYQKYLINDFLVEIEHIMTLCDKDNNCRNYHLQINEEQKVLLSESTLDCNIKNNTKNTLNTKRITDFLPPSLPVLHTSLPLYGALIVCGFVFLFSVYHYLSQRKLNAENKYAIPVEYFVKASNAPTANKPSVVYNHKILNLSGKDSHSPTFAEKLTEHAALQILFANNCKLSVCTSFSHLTKLEELYLHNNQLYSVQGLTSLTHLKVLVLSKNKLTDISLLTGITTLTTLDLSHNKKLKNITSLTVLKKLQYLILTDTNITQKEVRTLQKKLPHCTIFY